MPPRVRYVPGARCPFNGASGHRLATARLVAVVNSELLRFEKVKLRSGKDVRLGTDVTFAGPMRLLEDLLVDPKSSSLRTAFGLAHGDRYGVPPSVELDYHPMVSTTITTGTSVDSNGKPYCCIVFPFLFRLTATKT